jgi:hypothetical protein
MRSFITFTFAKYNWNDQVKEDVISRACSRHVKGRNWMRMHTGFSPESQEERNHYNTQT